MAAQRISMLGSRFARSLGEQTAFRETRWMKEVADLTPSPEATLAALLERRLVGEPLQYILGTQPFGSMDIRVRKPVLIPRPETEFWVTELVPLFQRTSGEALRTLDLCTGTGCIPLLLGSLCPELVQHLAVAVDVTEHAIALASENATLQTYRQLKDVEPHSPHARIMDIIKADIFDPLFPQTIKSHPYAPFHLLTCNPPYITRRAYAKLDPSVREWEDPLALIGETPPSTERDGDDDGLAFYHRLADLAQPSQSHEQHLLQPSAVVACEVGEGQAPAVSEIFSRVRGVKDVDIRKDQWGIERAVVVRMNGR